MARVTDINGKVYEVPDEVLDSYRVPPERLKEVLRSEMQGASQSPRASDALDSSGGPLIVQFIVSR